jgi:hypothetical protein
MVMNKNRFYPPDNFQIWVGFFLYTLFAGLLIQLVLLPYVFPAWHAGDGLLKGLDTAKFHLATINLLNKIHLEGWQAWVLKPHGQTVVGVATLFYGLISPHPWAMMPLNAILNASGGLAIFQILLIFIKDRKKALWATLPYMLFPTALSWTAQFHNDNYMVSGVAIFLLGWVQFSDRTIWVSWKKIVQAFANIFAGSVLIWFVRIYVLNVLSSLGIAVGLFLIICIIGWTIKKELSWKKCIPVILLIFFGWGASHFLISVNLVNNATRLKITRIQIDSGNLVDQEVTVNPTQNVENLDKKRPWSRTSWLPIEIDRTIRSLVTTRLSAIKPGSGSNVDLDVRLATAVDVLKYLPRAFEIGFFAPFPYQWFEQAKKAPNTMMRRVSGIEMVFIYISYVGLLYAIWIWRRAPGLWIFLIFCMGMITIYALAVANVGTLHRFRFGFVMPIVGLGVAGWIELIQSLLPKVKNLVRSKAK